MDSVFHVLKGVEWNLHEHMSLICEPSICVGMQTFPAERKWLNDVGGGGVAEECQIPLPSLC